MDKSLDRWRYELKTIGRKAWYQFYESMLGAKLSNYSRFNQALNLYGDWPLFEAIVDSSSRTLEGDPIYYVLKVAHEKWKSEQQTADADVEYANSIKRAKEVTTAKNKDLARRVKEKPKRKYTKRIKNGTDNPL